MFVAVHLSIHSASCCLPPWGPTPAPSPNSGETSLKGWEWRGSWPQYSVASDSYREAIILHNTDRINTWAAGLLLMNESRSVAFGPLAAIILAGVASYWTGQETLLGGTPLGVGIYLAIGVGLPQLLLWRRTSETARFAIGILAVGGAFLAVIWGFFTIGLAGTWHASISVILVLALLIVIGWTIVREFLSGFRSTHRKSSNH